MTGHAEALATELEAARARVVVIGLGYVGLPLATALAAAGFRVTGLERDASKLRRLERGASYVPDVPSERVADLVGRGQLVVTEDSACLAGADAIVVCVPTPLSKTKDPDLSYILEAVEALVPHLHAGLLVVLESTTYPGTTREIVAPRLAESGLVIGEEIFLAFSPERVDPGNPRFGLRNTPKVVGGMTRGCTAMAERLYRPVVDRLVAVSSTDAAEMAKLLENTFRAVNIGLVNEVALMCERLGLDAWEIIDAAATKPFGFLPFYPGPGLGGHCIPIDPLYLSWKLRTLRYTARFVELADEINRGMPEVVVRRVMEALNDEGRAVRGARILVLGVAYKKNVDDIRESPAIDVLTLLGARGASLDYHDPLVPSVSEHGLAMRSTDEPVFADYDCVLVLADHDAVDYRRVVSESRLVVDTRNATRGLEGLDGARVVKL